MVSRYQYATCTGWLVFGVLISNIDTIGTSLIFQYFRVFVSTHTAKENLKQNIFLEIISQKFWSNESFSNLQQHSVFGESIVRLLMNFAPIHQR